ncbi:MAG: discoidin domain-containing protein, partial [Acetivibrionales bacterium]
AEDVSFEQKGTIMPRRGRRKRYEEEFSDSPCCGLGSYYKKDGTTKLLFASGDKLYSDSPNMSFKWENQNDWEETNSEQVNLDSSTTPGDIQIKESNQTAPTPIFTRASVAYLEDGTEVEADKPRFEGGKFGKGVFIEEGTTNLADPAKQSPWMWTSRPYDWTCVTSLALTEGEVVTVSADIRNGDEGSRWCSITGTGVTAHTGYIDATKTRQTYTFTVTETTTHSIYLVSTDTTSYEYRNWQIEKKAYATSFVDGTRSSESLKIPTTSLSVTQGTISLWAKNLSASPNGSMLIDLPDNAGNQGMICGIANDGKLFIEDAKLQFQAVETSQADFNTGTLSDVQATSAGNLELVRDGQDFTYSETSQADFNTGTLTNVTATSEGNLELKYTPGETTYGTDFTGGKTYSADSVLSEPFSADKAFDNDTSTGWCSFASYPHWVKVDLGSGITKTARKLRFYKNDAQRPKTFKLQGSNDNSAWIDVYSGVVANAIGWFEFTFSNSTAYRYYRIYGIDSYETPPMYMQFAEIEIMEVTETQGTYAISGTRVKEIDISSAVATGGTKIEWSKTTPANTAVKVETALSTDGGTTYGAYQEATSGSSIPGISAGTNLSNAKLKIKETLSTTDTSVTPQLHSLNFDIYASYKSSGYRYKVYDISAVGSVGSSKITWTENKPASTTLTIKAAISTDGGSTYGSWQACTSGQAIPGLTQGMDISNARLKVQEELTTSDGTKTPQLQELTIDVGSNVQTAYGPNKSTLTGWDSISLAWKPERLSLVANDEEACYIENPGLPASLGSHIFIGTDRNGANAINTIVDELRIDNIARTDAEIADWYNANKPLIPDEYTTYLSHFDNSLSSEKLVPYAYWESAPKDVSQASNKASGKAVITQTLNSGKV